MKPQTNSAENPSASSDATADCCTGSDSCCGGLDRREFLKTAGLSVVSLSAAASPLGAMAGPFTRLGPEISHFVPADKKLSPDWVKKLFEKGAPQVWRGKELDTIAMPVGGITAGQMYLHGDGTLGCWQIFNRQYSSGWGADNYKPRTASSPVAQGFAAVIDSGAPDQVVCAKLDREGFPNVEFAGEYPIGRVRYQRDGLPVKIEMEAFSPFIPLNAKDSCLPATVFRITVENTSNQKIRASILAWLENPVCFHTAAETQGKRHSRVVREKARTTLLHTAEALPQNGPPPRPVIVLADFEGETYGDWKTTGEAFGDKPAPGTLPNQNPVTGFLGKGLVNTFNQGDGTQGTLTSPPFAIARKCINFLIGGGGHAGQTCINLLVESKVVRTATGKNNERLSWFTWNVEEFEGKQAQIEIVDKNTGGWGHINIDQIELSDESRRGPLEKMEDFGSIALALPGQAASAESLRGFFGAPPIRAAGLEKTYGLEVQDDAAYPLGEKRKFALLSPYMELAPGQKATFPFVLAWHFPNRGDVGQQYANWFKDAADVANYVLDNLDRLAADTRKWHDTYYDSTLPYWLLDRLQYPVSNLATGTCQWWKNGRFWAWEGVGCCHGTCAHVWNYAHALARLFPELERSAREMQDLGTAFHPDGMVSFRGEPNGNYAADGQAGTVLKCYREHLMSPDGEFLKRNWPRIKTVLGFSIAQDANNDGLIENSQHNTYDINFEGPNTFVGALYLAALRAGEEMAREMGDTEFADRVRKIFESGRKLSVEKLWNGEYFIQIVDLQKFPKDQYGEGCLADQLFGQGWAHQLALDYVYPVENVKKALQAVWKYDWAPDIGPQNAAHKPERWFAAPGEAGLFTCTWPKSEYLKEGVRYREEIWTGIEYQVAGHMVWEGMLTEALAMVRAIHDRYHPLKHNPYNEVECGDHYARALASWGVFTALSGYEYHGPKGHLGFAPRITPEDFRSAFTAAEGWGTFAQKRTGKTQRVEITSRWGRLRLKSLAFAVPAESGPFPVTVKAAGQPVEVAARFKDGRLTITLSKEITLKEGERLEAAIG